MKSFKYFLAALFVFAVSGIYGQSTAQVIAIVNQADWCSTCRSHGERVKTEVLANYREPLVIVAANNLTNKQTKAKSKAALEKLGVYKLVAAEDATGQIIFVDVKNKKVLGKISVAKSNEELKKAFDEAIRRT